MSSLSRFFTLLKFYFGDSLSRLLSLVYRGKMNGSVDSSSSIGGKDSLFYSMLAS
jgi:hypothetical protein